MRQEKRSSLRWRPECEREDYAKPQTPNVPDRQKIKLYDAGGREIEIQRRIGFNTRQS